VILSTNSRYWGENSNFHTARTGGLEGRWGMGAKRYGVWGLEGSKFLNVYKVVVQSFGGRLLMSGIAEG
jgi:hypothetical protein